MQTLFEFFVKKVLETMVVEGKVPGVEWFTVSQAHYLRWLSTKKWVSM